MASINYYSLQPPIVTHEGGRASKITPLQELERSVMSCFLWENSFYENGIHHAERLVELCQQVDNEEIAKVAIHARMKMNLRHIPLLLAVILVAKKFTEIAHLLDTIIQRPDEITEFVALYWKDGKRPLPNQVKKGLGFAFNRFNTYQLAKYNNQAKAIKLRDVLFLIHAKPANEEEALRWKKLANNELESPDTWEVALSKGADKKETFERLMTEKKLGAMAFIRNLRNMYQAGVSNDLVVSYFSGLNFDKVLPFRFITAALHAPQYTTFLEKAFLARMSNDWGLLEGNTVFLIDVSGSMEDKLSAKSEVSRMDAAAALALIGINLCTDSAVITFSNEVMQTPGVNNFSLIKYIKESQSHGRTELGKAIMTIMNVRNKIDRLIIITDEQSCDNVRLDSKVKNYIINVGSYENGVAYKQAVHINGFSENVFKFIIEYEKSDESA